MSGRGIDWLSLRDSICLSEGRLDERGGVGGEGGVDGWRGRKRR